MRAAAAPVSGNGATAGKKAWIMDGRRDSGKRKASTLRRVLIQLIGAWLVVLVAGQELYGQSCAMCYTTVAGGGKSFIHALQGGIIVLLIPPVLLFSGLTILLFRWRTSASVRTRPGAALVLNHD
jgi:hypothetical protein